MSHENVLIKQAQSRLLFHALGLLKQARELERLRTMQKLARFFPAAEKKALSGVNLAGLTGLGGLATAAGGGALAGGLGARYLTPAEDEKGNPNKKRLRNTLLGAAAGGLAAPALMHTLNRPSADGGLSPGVGALAGGIFGNPPVSGQGVRALTGGILGDSQ